MCCYLLNGDVTTNICMVTSENEQSTHTHKERQNRFLSPFSSSVWFYPFKNSQHHGLYVNLVGLFAVIIEMWEMSKNGEF